MGEGRGAGRPLRGSPRGSRCSRLVADRDSLRADGSATRARALQQSRESTRRDAKGQGLRDDPTRGALGDARRDRRWPRGGRAWPAGDGRAGARVLTGATGGRCGTTRGDHPAAEAILRAALAGLAASGEWARYSTDVGMLAESLYAQGRFEEAETCAESCRDLASLDDVSSQILWRGVVAKLRARDGNHETAVEAATAAVALVATTDLLTQHADRLVDLAEVHALAGRRADAPRRSARPTRSTRARAALPPSPRRADGALLGASRAHAATI